MWSFLGETPQLAFHPDSAHLAITGFQEEAARILNVATGEWDQELVGAGSPARGVRYLADGTRIATSAAYGSIALWDTATGGHLFSVTLESAAARLLLFDVSPDGSKLAATSDDGSIRVWNLQDNQGPPAMRLHASDIPMGIAFSPDGRQLAGVTADELGIWNVTSEGRGEVIALEGGGSMTAFSPDGSLLAARQGGDVVVLHTATWEQVARLDHGGSSSTDAGPRGVAWSPDGDRIATTAGDDVPIPGPGRIQVWSAETGSLLRTLSDVSQPQGDIAFGAGGRIAAALCERSVDGLSWGSPAKVWDADTGDELFVVPAADCGDAVDLDPAGRLLAIQIEEGEEVQLWNLDTGALTGAVPHAPGSGGGVRFSPDGSQLVTAGTDWTAKVWDVTTFEQVLVLEGHRGVVTQAVWSPDGETIVTGATDGTVRLWDAETGEVRLVLSGHEGGLVSLSVSPDGTRLASSGVDGALRVWAIDLDELIAIAESRLSRTPTEAECEAYGFEVCSQ
jgi:WD40 repeat protein